MGYPNLFRLEGKTAIVTGALGILGRRFCAGLADFGANLATIDLEESKSIAFAEEIAERYGVPTCGIGCDVSSPQSVAAMVQRVKERFGEIHVLHNNAATKSSDLDGFFAPFEEYSLDQWRTIMATNIDGMFLVAQAVGREMVRQGRGGSIIQTSSIYGIVAPDQRVYEGSSHLGRQINTPAVYAASKAAVVGLSRYLATYWAPHGIRVNTLVPGGVESGQDEEFRKRYALRVPMGRMAEGDEMVAALVYLASDASSYVTGQEIVVDGGLTAW